jgi:hypothetical protein
MNIEDNANQSPDNMENYRTLQQGLELGFSMIVLAKNTKKSCIDWKDYQTRKAPEDEVAIWTKKFPNANPAAVTGEISDIVVIDIDGQEGYDLYWDRLPSTLTCQSPGGEYRYHLYYRYPKGLGRVRNFQKGYNNGDMPGIDFKADGGYVAFPGSVHKNGGVYEWLEGHGPGEIEIADLPGWFINYIRGANARYVNQAGDWLEAAQKAVDKTASAPSNRSDRQQRRLDGCAKAALDKQAEKVAFAQQGRRNTQLYNSVYSLAPFVREGYLRQADVEFEMENAARRCGLHKDDGGTSGVRSTIRSGLKLGWNGSLPDMRDDVPLDGSQGWVKSLPSRVNNEGKVDAELSEGDTLEATETDSTEDNREVDPATDSPNNSANLRDVVSAERILTFRTAREIAEHVGTEVEWIVEPWVARGAITELTGKVKAAGKTTWVTHLIAATVNGSEFMGRQVMRTPVLYLTEQPEQSFREALRRANLLDSEDLHVLLWHDAKSFSWVDVIRMTVAKAVELGASLIVIDTLTALAGVREENSAGEAQRAMAPLIWAAGEFNGAIVTVRHERKSGGEVGDSGRGSSAFGGAVDIMLSLGRGEGAGNSNARVLEALSRFDETPSKVTIELTDDGYILLGGSANVSVEIAKRQLRDILPTDEDRGETLDQLKARLVNVQRTTLQTALEELQESGEVHQTGRGVKGDPLRYWKSISDNLPTP